MGNPMVLFDSLAILQNFLADHQSASVEAQAALLVMMFFLIHFSSKKKEEDPPKQLDSPSINITIIVSEDEEA